MTLETDLINTLGIGPLNELLDDAEDNGNGLVSVANVRRAMAGQPLDGDQPGPASVRRPQPGDVVLIRATVARDPEDDGTVLVSMLGRSDAMFVAVQTDAIATVLGIGPTWWPPQTGDVVLDGVGASWQRVSHAFHGKVWLGHGDSLAFDDELLANHGPLTLIARDGKRWES